MSLEVHKILQTSLVVSGRWIVEFLGLYILEGKNSVKRHIIKFKLQEVFI